MSNSDYRAGKERRAKILAAFDEADPWGLIEGGAPQGEYLPEVDLLLEKKESGEEITPEAVLKTFLYMGGSGEENNLTYDEIAPHYSNGFPSISREKAEALAAILNE